MLAIIEGSLDVYVEDNFYRLEQGDVVLIGANQLHRDRQPEGRKVVYYVLQFDIRPFFDRSIMPYFHHFTEPGTPMAEWNDGIRGNAALRQELHRCVGALQLETERKEHGYEIAVNILIKSIILSLLRSRASASRPELKVPDWQRFKPVLDYVEHHLTGEIRVTEASRLANISYHYFVKSFKQTFGLSFVEYVQLQKVKLAERILLTENVKVAEAGEAVGLPNMAHFYKCFKRFTGCSPNEFRKKMGEWAKT